MAVRAVIALLALSSVGHASPAEEELAQAAEALSRLELRTALAHFAAARELAPGKPGPIFGMAVATAALGRCKEALPLVEEYLRLNPQAARADAQELLVNCRLAVASTMPPPPPPPPRTSTLPPKSARASEQQRVEQQRTIAVNLTYWCNEQRAGSCRNLGAMYDEGDGVAIDKRRAAQLYQLACGLGDAGGCTNLGEMYLHGEGVARDEKRAGELHAQACKAGDATGCFNLALYCEKVLHNRSTAVGNYRRACQLGDEDSCTWLEEEGEEERHQGQ